MTPARHGEMQGTKARMSVEVCHAVCPEQSDKVVYAEV